MSASGVWRSRLRRWRWPIAVVALAIAVRVALPEVIRRVAISQASQNLRAKVDLGNVDLYLWRGGIVLEDFGLRPLDSSDEPGTPTEKGADEPTTPPLPPIVAWKRLALGVSFRPLWNKTIQLYEVALDSPQIALDRLADGQLNVMSVLPASEAAAAPETAPPTPAAPAAEEGGWRYGVDRLVIGTGKLVFRDLMVTDSEPVEIGIPSIEVTDIALDPQVYGGPLNSRVKILLDEGSLEIGARLSLDGETTTLDAEVEAHNLPLRRSRLYVPGVGWRELRGLLDTDLHYQLQTGQKNEVRGTVTLREVAVNVQRLPDAALSWKALSVRVDPIDLLAQSAHVSEVDLKGAVLTVDPHSTDQLPVLARPQAPAAVQATPGGTAVTPAALPEPTPPATPAADDALEAKPWRWSVDSVRLSESLVRLLTPTTPFDVGVEVEVTHLVDHGEEPANVDVGLTLGDGSIAVSGNGRVDPPGFGGTLKVAKLSLPELIAASAAMPDSPLLSARLDTDLGIAAGMPLPGAATAIGAQDLRLSGTVTVSEVRLAPPGMKDVDVGLRQLGITLTQLDLPGMLAVTAAEGALPSPGRGDLSLQGEIALAEPSIALADGKEFFVGAKEIRVGIAKVEMPGLLAEPPVERPKVVALRELRLDTPVVRLTRTANGLVLPGTKAAEAPAAPAAPASPAAATAEPVAVENPAPATREPAGPPPLDFSLASFQLTKGRIDVVDRSVKPTFNGGLSSLDVRARDIRWPKLAVRQLKLDTRTPGSGQIEIQGDLTSEGGTVQFDGRQVDLPSLNPYALAYSPFKIGSGALTLSTKVSFKGESYVVGNSVTLHQLDLTGKEGESMFEQNFGVPLSTALALLRDAQGDIAMDIPLQVDREGTKIDLVGIAGGALRRALVNALTSPLRLLGAVTGTGDKVASIAPASVPFRRGRAATEPDGEKRLEQVGSFLASRPTLVVELETQATESDVRWLREQALLHTWDQQGLFASFLSKVQAGDARQRIQAALSERAEDGAGKLSDEDARTLDEWLAEQPPIAPEQLATLVQARLSLAQAAVIRNVEPARVLAAPPAAGLGDGQPELRLKLKPLDAADRGEAE